MRANEITEGVGVITKQNTTKDVDAGSISREAAKLGMKVDKGGRPPLLHKYAAKNSTPHKLDNLGMVK